ncbi:response regulator [Pseudomonas syringae]|uniref:response regulator n=1 Tax=Pseudomonas syringae TaxID=317 RepID=UPI001F51451E|nr:response regulator [Pseudomonas syringae]
MSQNILLVEDDLLLRSVMAEAVSILGHAVTECAGADQALTELEEMECCSLVITDVRMPGRLDGLHLSRTIWSRWPELPVIIMSANTTIPPGTLPSNAKFLTKPVHLSSLHEVIAELLAKERLANIRTDVYRGGLGGTHDHSSR